MSITWSMIGRPPTSTIGLGMRTVSSESRDPSPPARSTVCMVSPPDQCAGGVPAEGRIARSPSRPFCAGELVSRPVGNRPGLYQRRRAHPKGLESRQNGSWSGDGTDEDLHLRIARCHLGIAARAGISDEGRVEL